MVGIWNLEYQFLFGDVRPIFRCELLGLGSVYCILWVVPPPRIPVAYSNLKKLTIFVVTYPPGQGGQPKIYFPQHEDYR